MQVAKDTVQFVPSIALILAYVVLEIHHQRTFQKSFALDILFELFKATIHAGKELFSKEAAKVLCGAVTMLLILVCITLLIYALNCALTQPDAFKHIIRCGLGILLFGPSTVVWHRLNRWFIARG